MIGQGRYGPVIKSQFIQELGGTILVSAGNKDLMPFILQDANGILEEMHVGRVTNVEKKIHLRPSPLPASSALLYISVVICSETSPIRNTTIDVIKSNALMLVNLDMLIYVKT